MSFPTSTPPPPPSPSPIEGPRRRDWAPYALAIGLLVALLVLAGFRLADIRRKDAAAADLRGALPTLDQVEQAGLVRAAAVETQPVAWEVLDTASFTRSANRPRPSCGADGGTEILVQRVMHLHRLGDDENFVGKLTVNIRRFATPAQAESFVAAHRGSEFESCHVASRTSTARHEGRAMPMVVLSDVEPVGSGTAVATVASGAPLCDIEERVYWNASGRDAVTVAIDACTPILDTEADRALVRAIVERLDALDR